jgi:hypothetical protein
MIIYGFKSWRICNTAYNSLAHIHILLITIEIATLTIKVHAYFMGVAAATQKFHNRTMDGQQGYVAYPTRLL